MKYLLDTHIWLWSAMDAKRLVPRTAKIMADPENELWLSPVSVWELALLLHKGRFRVQPDISSWVAATMSDLKLTEAPLTLEVMLAIPTISFAHGDPGDQFLAATAKTFDLTLVTADEHLMQLAGIRVLANR